MIFQLVSAMSYDFIIRFKLWEKGRSDLFNLSENLQNLLQNDAELLSVSSNISVKSSSYVSSIAMNDAGSGKDEKETPFFQTSLNHPSRAWVVSRECVCSPVYSESFFWSIQSIWNWMNDLISIHSLTVVSTSCIMLSWKVCSDSLFGLWKVETAILIAIK